MRRVPHPADDDAPEGRPIYQSRAFASFTIALNILPNLNVGAVEAAQRCVGARVSGGALPPTSQHRAARPARTWNVHRLVGLRVAPLARLALLRVERPEVNQRDLVAVRDRLDDDVQRCRDTEVRNPRHSLGAGLVACFAIGRGAGRPGARARQARWRGVQAACAVQAGWAKPPLDRQRQRAASSRCNAPALSTSSAVFFETPALSEIASTSWPLETPDLLATSPSAPSALCMRICAADARSAVDSGCCATGRCMH